MPDLVLIFCFRCPAQKNQALTAGLAGLFGFGRRCSPQLDFGGSIMEMGAKVLLGLPPIGDWRMWFAAALPTVECGFGMRRRRAQILQQPVESPRRRLLALCDVARNYSFIRFGWVRKIKNLF